MRLFLLVAHKLHTASKLNSLNVGPSVDIKISWLVILLLSLLRKGVLIRLRVEKPLSQSAVEAGISNAIRESLHKLGNSVVKFSAATRLVITWCGSINFIAMDESSEAA